MALTIVRRGKEERLAIRISPEDKFAVELYARKTGKTISAVAKEALDKVLRSPESGLFSKATDGALNYLPPLCWDPLQPDRVVKLATFAPELLDDFERTVWKVICEDKMYWQRRKEPIYPKIREDWAKISFKALALLKEHSGVQSDEFKPES